MDARSGVVMPRHCADSIPQWNYRIRTAASRLPRDLAQDRCLARLGPGARRDAPTLRLPAGVIGVAIKGCNGIGAHIAHRLVHDGEVVLDVPPKLSAQVRVFATDNGRKTDPAGAHSVA